MRHEDCECTAVLLGSLLAGVTPDGEMCLSQQLLQWARLASEVVGRQPAMAILLDSPLRPYAQGLAETARAKSTSVGEDQAKRPQPTFHHFESA